MSPYTTEHMQYLWSDHYTLGTWANVEIALLTAQAQHSIIPLEWAEIAAATPPPTVAEWYRHLETTRHELVAFLDAWGLEHVHIGCTSSDIIDTANALRYRAISDHISTAAYRLREALINRALETADTPRLGRTHGQTATPTTLGHRLADLATQADRGAHRLDHARRDLETGMINGPTGGYHNIDPATEQTALELLHLKPAGITTQIIARDSLTHYAAALIGLIETCAAYALEVRLGQHQAIEELYENHHPDTYIGSSTMPHKRNPSDSERITGLARIARAYYAPLAESVETWHERDISHSSVERTIMPQLTGIAHYALTWAETSVLRLGYDPDRMGKNIHRAEGLGTHDALYHAQLAGMSYRQARIAAQKRPGPIPQPPDSQHLKQQVQKIGSKPRG